MSPEEKHERRLVLLDARKLFTAAAGLANLVGLAGKGPQGANVHLLEARLNALERMLAELEERT